MRTYKIIDALAQVLLIVLAIVMSLVYSSTFLGEKFMYSYVLIGAWQLISLLIHFFLPATFKIRARFIYIILLVITVLAGVVIGIAADDNLIGFMYAMLFWTPALALFYAGVCCWETRKMRLTASK
ncbi:MAG: hypothetical protein ACKVOW_01295 [Chitinophagaceae bacterium]